MDDFRQVFIVNSRPTWDFWQMEGMVFYETFYDKKKIKNTKDKKNSSKGNKYEQRKKKDIGESKQSTL